MESGVVDGALIFLVQEDPVSCGITSNCHCCVQNALLVARLRNYCHAK